MKTNKTLSLVNNDSLSRGGILLALYLKDIPSGEIEKGQLCQILDMSERNVRRILQDFEKRGWVTSWIENRKRIYRWEGYGK